jgi:hypothetical protein
MPDFTEGGIRFKFSDAVWSNVLFYDERDDQKRPILPELEKINRATGASSVEFIGILQAERLVFMEVKDFRQHRIENKARLSSNELAVEIAVKVKDTIAGIVGGARLSTHQRVLFKEFVRYLNSEKKIIEVVLWLEEDARGLPSTILEKRNRAGNFNLSKQLKEKLNWLTHQVVVMNKKKNGYEGALEIEFLKK